MEFIKSDSLETKQQTEGWPESPALSPSVPFVFGCFFQVYPAQALLLLVTGALGFRIIYASLSPALPVLNTFKVTSCSFLLNTVGKGVLGPFNQSFLLIKIN